MKSLKLLRLVVPILLINHCASTAKAQQPQKEVKEEYHIRIVTEENGSRKVIDTIFSNLEDLKRFQDKQAPQAHAANDSAHQWLHEIITEDVMIINGDTTINKNIHTKKLTADDLEHLHAIIDSEGFEGADVIKIIGLDSMKKGPEIKVTAFLTFIDIETPTKEELKNNSNPEMQKSTFEKSLVVNNLKVHPNPSKGNITVDFVLAEKGKTQLLVTDLQGKEIYKEEFMNDGPGLQTRQLDLSGQAGGVYLLKIKTGEKSAVHKIVLQPSAE